MACRFLIDVAAVSLAISLQFSNTFGRSKVGVHVDNHDFLSAPPSHIGLPNARRVLRIRIRNSGTGNRNKATSKYITLWALLLSGIP
jgi:hypothetical protein